MKHSSRVDLEQKDKYLLYEDLDKIITENGIDLVDSSAYSRKINELISQYNEEIQRKQKQSELTYVLQLVRDKKLHN